MQVELRLYDTAGERQPLPEQAVLGWEFELLDRGGFGTFSLELAAEMDDVEFPTLPAADWRWEAWFDNALAYRGRVERTQPPIEAGAPSFSVQGSGRMTRCATLLVDCVYVKPHTADASEVFAWLAGTFLVGTDRLGEFTQAIPESLGYPIERAELFGTDVRAAFDRLAESSEDLVLWGFDASPDGNDRLYVRRRPTTVTTEAFRFRVGKDVESYEHSEDLSELCNALRLTGGASKAPNLVNNPSFELPQAAGEAQDGNLLKNASFESAAVWTFGGSAARQASDGEPGEYARTGAWLAEVDAGGDYVQQSVTLPAGLTGSGKSFRVTIHHAIQNPGTAEYRVTLEGLDNSNAVMETLLDPSITDTGDKRYSRVAATARSYQEWHRQVTTGNAGTTKLRIKIAYQSGPSVLLDDVWLHYDGYLVQEGWSHVGQGTGAGEIDWGHRENAYHGCYCVQARTSGCSSASHNVLIRPQRENWISTRTATQYRFRVWIRAAAALDLRLGLQRWNDSGSTSRTWSSVLTTSSDGAWHRYEATLSVGSSAVNFRPEIELRSNGVYWIDAVDVFEVGIEERSEFLDGERLTYRFRADEAQVVRTDLAMHATDNRKLKSAGTPFAATDVGKLLQVTGGTSWTTGAYTIQAYDGTEYVTVSATPADATTTGGQGIVSHLPGLSAAARTSITTYGLRERFLEVEEIRDLTAAKTYATGFFNRFAIPAVSGRLVLQPAEVHLRHVDGDADATALGLVAIAGARSPIPDQHPVRFTYSQQRSEPLRCEVELTNRAPSTALLLRKALAGGGGSGGGGGGVNLRPAPGSTVSGGENGQVPTWRVDSADVGSRSRLNLIAGSGVTLTGVDDSGDDEVEVTIDVATGSGLTPLLLGRRLDLTNAATSYGQMPLEEGLVMGQVMPYSGTIFAIAVTLDGDVGGSGDAFYVKAYKDTGSGFAAVSPALEAVVTGGAGTEDQAYVVGGTATFNAGDKLVIFDKKAGSPAVRGCKAFLFVAFD